MEYEDALIDFFRDVKVGHEKIGGLPWTEIDFPEDVTRAEREILPRSMTRGRFVGADASARDGIANDEVDR